MKSLAWFGAEPQAGLGGRRTPLVAAQKRPSNAVPCKKNKDERSVYRMKISTQTSKIFQVFGEKEGIRILAQAGYDCIDFSFFHTLDPLNEDSPTRLKDYNDTARELRAYAESLGVTFNQAHAPFPSSVGDAEKDAKIFDAIVRSMEIASILGVKHIIVHPKQHLPYKGNERMLKEINMEFYRALTPYCEKFGIKVAVENMWQRDPNRRYIVHSTCASPAEMNEYLNGLDPKWFAACIDIGHCALVGEDIGEMIRTVGPRLHALHVHDVDYINDCHTLPGVQKLNFDAVAKALADARYDGELTLEADNFLTHFEREFYPEAARFMATRARYIAGRVDAYRAADKR